MLLLTMGLLFGLVILCWCLVLSVMGEDSAHAEDAVRSRKVCPSGVDQAPRATLAYDAD
jgi:hypothetical protein